MCRRHDHECTFSYPSTTIGRVVLNEASPARNLANHCFCRPIHDCESRYLVLEEKNGRTNTVVRRYPAKQTPIVDAALRRFSEASNIIAGEGVKIAKRDRCQLLMLVLPEPTSCMKSTSHQAQYAQYVNGTPRTIRITHGVWCDRRVTTFQNCVSVDQSAERLCITCCTVQRTAIEASSYCTRKPCLFCKVLVELKSLQSVLVWEHSTM